MHSASIRIDPPLLGKPDERHLEVVVPTGAPADHDRRFHCLSLTTNIQKKRHNHQEMAWPKRVNWLGWIAGIVIALIILIVGVTVLGRSSDQASKQLGDTLNKASEE